MYDQVRVYFTDGTNTLVNVHEDETIQDAITAVADEEGVEIADYRIEQTVSEDEPWLTF